MIVLASVILAGCGSSHVAPGATGNLTITITPADGTTPAVVVRGPSAYFKAIANSQTLTNLAAGSYTVFADTSFGPDSIVGTVTDTGSVSASPVTITAGVTDSVAVRYVTKYWIGGLWVANYARPTVPEVASNQLQATGSVKPADTLVTVLHNPDGMALDPSGNMWVSGYNTDTLLMYTPTARNAGGAVAPSAVLVGTGVADGEDITFDAHGNLWVGDCSGDAIHEYTAAQLAAAGTQAPSVTISGGTTLQCPIDVAFDASGNMWVADDGNTSHIVMYSAAQLTASGTPTPADTIGANAGSLTGTDALVFDSTGNLWVGNDGASIVEFTPAQLAAGGTPTPNVTITVPSGRLVFGLAIDRRGTLWGVDNDNGAMLGYTRAQLAVGGSLTPAVILAVSFDSVWAGQQPMFDPYATGVGAAAARVRFPTAPLAQAVASPAWGVRRHRPKR
jgi:sugar lactone lactonase YvrE